MWEQLATVFAFSVFSKYRNWDALLDRDIQDGSMRTENLREKKLQRKTLKDEYF